MADIQQAIRLLKTIASIEGADAVTAKLKEMGKAHGDIAVASDTTSKASLSLESSFEKLERRYITTIAQQQNYAKIQQQVAAATAQNPALIERGNAVLDAAAIKYGQAGAMAKLFTAATSGMSGQLIALSAGAGPVGTFLAALGPWGLAGAAGIGLIAAAFEEAKRTSHLLAAESIELEKFAETTGLSTDSLQALTQAAAKHGVSAEDATNSIIKFTTAWGEARDGGGAFLTQLQKINPALADQMQRTTSSAEAFDLLTKAIQQADAAGNIAQRNQLLRAAGGRGGVVALTGVASAVGDAGGLSSLTKQAQDAGTVIEANLLKEVKNLQTEIDETKKRADLLMGTIGAKPILETELAWEKLRLKTAQMSATLADADKAKPFWQWFFEKLALTSEGGNGIIELAQRVMAPSLPGAPVGKVTSGGSLPDLTAPKDSKAQLADLKEQISLLGSAATANDKLKLRLLEIDTALKGNTTSENQLAAARGMSAAKLDAYTELLALHNAALGAAATVADIVTAKNATLAKMQMQGAGLTDAQIKNAQRLNQAQADGTFALQANIDSMRVQAGSYDMAAGKAETYRIIQTKINENLNAGRPALDGMSQDFYKLANAAGAGAQALEQVRVKSTITFGQNTAFLTSEDVQIATQLKGLYGNDIPAAMASSEAAALRLNNAMSTTSQQISGGLTTALVDVSMGTKTAGDAFRDFSLLAIRAIQQMIVQLMIVGPLMRSLQSGFGGGGFNLLSLFGGTGGGGTGGLSGTASGGAAATLSAMGNVFDRGNVVHAFAAGGIVNSPTIFPMANGTGLMGEAGPEAIMPLKRGADGRLGVSGGAAPLSIAIGGTTITIQGDANAETLQAIRAELDKRDRELPNKINAVVRDAKSRRAA